jgi:hypothetical protein
MPTRAEIITEMRSTEQVPGLSVLAHGESVRRRYVDLMRVVSGRPARYEWRMPEWAFSSALWNHNFSDKVVREYQVYHDCGKPYCRTEADDGSIHFQDHAQVSADLWRAVGNNDAAHLMGRDMAIHTMKAGDIPEFIRETGANILLLTALCEVHSNADMFGGISSPGFKMKWKQVDRRGKAIVRLYMKGH